MLYKLELRDLLRKVIANGVIKDSHKVVGQKFIAQCPPNHFGMLPSAPWAFLIGGVLVLLMLGLPLYVMILLVKIVEYGHLDRISPGCLIYLNWNVTILCLYLRVAKQKWGTYKLYVGIATGERELKRGYPKKVLN